MRPAATEPAVVFFDGGCPLCAREIAHYQRRRMAAGAIEWVDVTRAPDRLAAEGLTADAALRRLHVRVGATWQIGVPGFVAIWQRIPAYRPLAWIVRGLRLQAPLQWLYTRWADRRMARRCAATDLCQPPQNRDTPGH
jgi:predicted DCC family thiol-disulfide oxidoreductase YuxK